MAEKYLRVDPNDETKTVEVPVFKIFESEEEFNKNIQSVSSKAKGEILTELGIKSVAEAKDSFGKIAELQTIKNTLTTKETAYTELELKYDGLVKENTKQLETLVVNKYDVPDNFKEDFKLLVRAGVGEDKTFEQSAEEVFNRLNLTRVKDKIIIGGTSHQVPPIEEKAKLKGLTKI